VEGGPTVVEVYRQVGITEQTFYTWKRKYAGLGLSKLLELRQLQEENTKLKRLVADQSLTGEKVTQALEPVVFQRGAPRSITVDNGSEFASRVMDALAYRPGLLLDFIRPGQAGREQLHRKLQRTPPR
jgi:putative transposase